MVDLDHRRLPMRPRQPVEHVDHVVRRERAACFGRKRLARVLVDHGQHAEPAAVLQLVVHEVHAPALVLARRCDRRPALAEMDVEPAQRIMRKHGRDARERASPCREFRGRCAVRLLGQISDEPIEVIPRAAAEGVDVEQHLRLP
jgi:hypothetical protein